MVVCLARGGHRNKGRRTSRSVSVSRADGRAGLEEIPSNACMDFSEGRSASVPPRKHATLSSFMEAKRNRAERPVVGVAVVKKDVPDQNNISSMTMHTNIAIQGERTASPTEVRRPRSRRRPARRSARPRPPKDGPGPPAATTARSLPSSGIGRLVQVILWGAGAAAEYEMGTVLFVEPLPELPDFLVPDRSTSFAPAPLLRPRDLLSLHLSGLLALDQLLFPWDATTAGVFLRGERQPANEVRRTRPSGNPKKRDRRKGPVCSMREIVW